MTAIHKLYLEHLEAKKENIPLGVWNCLNVVDTILEEKGVKL